MGYECGISIDNIEKVKSELEKQFELLKLSKEKILNEIWAEKEKIYQENLRNLEIEAKNAIKLYNDGVSKIELEVKKNFFRTSNSEFNRIFSLDINGNTKILQNQIYMSNLIKKHEEMAKNYNQKLDVLSELKKDIFKILSNIEKLEDNKNNNYRTLTSDKVSNLENELKSIDEQINEFWSKNKIIDNKIYDDMKKILNCNPQRKDVNDVYGILHLAEKYYNVKGTNIGVKYPLYKNSDNYSTTIYTKNKESIESLNTFVFSYVLRLIFALGANNLSVNIVDVKENGMQFSNILALSKEFPQFINDKPIFDENGLDGFLNNLNNELLNRGKILYNLDIKKYNETNDKKMKNLVYVINNYEIIFKSNVKLFENLLKLGSKYGIYLILVSDTDVSFDEYYKLLSAMHSKNFKYNNFALFSNLSDTEMVNVKNIISLSSSLSKIKVGYDKIVIYKANTLTENLEKGEVLLNPEYITKSYYNETAVEELKNNLKVYCKKMQDRENKLNKLNFEQLISKIPRNQSSKDGIKIPIGVNGKGEFLYIEFSDDYVDTILTGKAGTGKSTLYHYMLLNSMYMYGPDELKIYILDLKEAIEFSMYSNYYLPSIDGIYGNRTNPMEILEYLSDEITRRSILFSKSKNVKNIVEYRESGKKLPRILLILDEFQIILGDSNGKNDKAKEYLTRIITQGRAEGIHIIMCAQDISQTGSGLTSSISEQLTTRVLLKSTENSADVVLRAGNTENYSDFEVRKVINEIINFPKGMGIINNKSGNIEYNEIFRFPNIESKDIARHLEILSKENEEKGLYKKPICKIHFENYISSLEPNYYKNRFNLNRYPVAVLAEYMKFKDSILKVEFLKDVNSNIFIRTDSLKKSDSILESFFISMRIWNKYNKNRAKIYILNFGNLSKSIVDAYITDENSTWINFVKFNNNIDELNLVINKIKSDASNGLYPFVIINRIDMFKEYYDNIYDCSDEINEFINNITYFYENRQVLNVNMIAISNGVSEAIDRVMFNNSKIFLFESNSLFTEEYYSNLFNRSSNILYKNMDESPNLSVEINLYVKDEIKGE